MLEASRAAAHCLLDDAKLDSSAGSTASALCGISIPAPLPLPVSGSGGGGVPPVRCVVSHGNGAWPTLQLQSRSAVGAAATNIQAAVCTHVQLPVGTATAPFAACRSTPLRWALAASLVPAAGLALGTVAACGSIDLRGQLAAPGFHSHPAALDAATHFGVFAVPEARTAGGSIGSHAVQLRVPAGAAYFHAPRQGAADGARWPTMSSNGGNGAASGVTVVSCGLLQGVDSGASCWLYQLHLKPVQGRPGVTVSAKKAATSLASYSARREAHSVGGEATAAVPGCAVSLSGPGGAVYLMRRAASREAAPAAVWIGAQRALRFLQQQQSSDSLTLVAATPDICGTMPAAASRAGAAGATVAAAVQGMLRCAAAEGRAMAGSVTRSTLAASGQPTLAPAGDVFSAPHLRQGAWLLATLGGSQHERAPLRLAAVPSLTCGGAAISGGTGALGLLVAAWLAAQDSGTAATGGQLCLWARSAAVRLPDALAGSARRVTVVQCDASAAADVAAAAQRKGAAVFVHAGGVLGDAMLAQQTAGKLRAALAPKLAGLQLAWAALAAQPVRQCLLFSSAAALLGNAGQASYGAVNAALDAAAAWRLQQGGAAVSLQWGPWAGGGMATAAVAARLAAKGVGLVQPQDGLRLLRRLMVGGGVSALHSAALAPLVAADWRRMLSPAQRQSTFFAALVPPEEGGCAASGRHASLPAAHSPQAAAPQHASVAGAAAPSAGPSVQQILEQLLALVAGLIGGPMEPTAAFMSAGLDSLGQRVCLCPLAKLLGCVCCACLQRCKCPPQDGAACMPLKAACSDCHQPSLAPGCCRVGGAA